ncbi:antitoxin Xre/MbcA/ParS toxin-binding domain-containing protein [Lysobacter soli]|uniref:antitoxin Xre/MbcA/ParS toxin-binding domain-containing protein n=1 Tax=Lysobacter soli TaxID=453783 RepID=UPI003CCDECD6
MNAQCRGTRMIERMTVEVFGNREKAARWLATWNAVLEGAPSALAATRDGRRQVYEELIRIYHGDFA